MRAAPLSRPCSPWGFALPPPGHQPGAGREVETGLAGAVSNQRLPRSPGRRQGRRAAGAATAAPSATARRSPSTKCRLSHSFACCGVGTCCPALLPGATRGSARALLALEAPQQTPFHAAGAGSEQEAKAAPSLSASVAQTPPSPAWQGTGIGAPGPPAPPTAPRSAPAQPRALLTMSTKTASSSARHSRSSWFRTRSRARALVRKEAVPMGPAGNGQL